MALDVYVMPIWKFKVGDFQSPVEEHLGIAPKRLTTDGVVEHQRRIGFFECWKAKRQVAAIRRQVETANSRPIRWRDDGAKIYGEQAHSLTDLRAYARWLDCRDDLPEFGSPPNDNYYEHEVWKVAGERKYGCPHLVQHSCYSGYFLPCDFEKLVQVEPHLLFNRWRMTHCVGSTPRLMRDLATVQEALELPDDYQYFEGDRLSRVKFALLQLKTIAQLSLKHGLPIVFFG